jgi:DNA-binding transcriptional LysR family regulator
MDWYLLRYFLAVAELGNFSRAAGQMNVTQPTLSAGIAKLESQLGHRLFERDKRRVSLTPAGSRFLVHAQRIAHDYEMALRDLSHTPRRRVLRVGVLSTIPTAMIEAAVMQHQAEGSPEDLEIVDGSERELKGRLDDNGIDIALTILRSGAERFLVESLYREDYVLTVSKRHRLAQAHRVNGEELAQDAMIIRRHCEVLAATSRYFTERGVRPCFGLKTTNDDRALALVRAGLGVTVMPQSFRDADIRQIKLVDFEMSREIGMIFSDRGRSVATERSAFVDTIRQLMEKGGSPVKI